MCGGCELGSAKAPSSLRRSGCFDVFCLFLHIAVTWCFGIFACKTHCNGCMNVAWGLIWGESRPEHETLCVSVDGCSRQCMKGTSCARRVRAGFGQGSMKGTSCARRVGPRLGAVRTVMAASMCFACSCASHLHGVLQSLLAKCIAMAA